MGCYVIRLCFHLADMTIKYDITLPETFLKKFDLLSFLIAEHILEALKLWAWLQMIAYIHLD